MRRMAVGSGSWQQHVAVLLQPLGAWLGGGGWCRPAAAAAARSRMACWIIGTQASSAATQRTSKHVLNHTPHTRRCRRTA
jgi:hypothetical protein